LARFELELAINNAEVGRMFHAAAAALFMLVRPRDCDPLVIVDLDGLLSGGH
jgi:hypothetical protein